MTLNTIFKNKIWEALWGIFTRAFIQLGLPLLAWGVDDIAGFFSNAARATYAFIVMAHALVYAYEIYVIPGYQQHEPRVDIGRWHAYIFETIYVLAAFGDRRNILAWSENPPLRWLGLAFYLVGVVVLVWADWAWINHLRREKERVLASAVLLEEGVFAYVRHPALLALIFFSLGVALAYRSWIGLALMPALWWGIVNRIDNMEKVYAKKYDKLWRARMAHSSKLIPLLY